MDLLSDTRRIELRWPAILAVLFTLVLLMVLPERIMLLPAWVMSVLAAVVIVPMLAVGLTDGRDRWARVERTAMLVFLVVAPIGVVSNLTLVVLAMATRSSSLTGLELLASGIAIWLNNVLAFSLVYWHVDRGGPEARARHVTARPDWLFPQEGAVDSAPPGWRPTFIDYMFLAYCTATAFSPTDALPLTPRAKLLMMLESAISLITVLVVAARAINILGG